MSRTHHLSCGTLRPAAFRPPFGVASVVCHCLLVEHEAGLLLVDTGIGTADVVDPVPTLEPWFVEQLGPVLDLEETALHRVRALGHDPEAVTDIVLTHPDRDHAGGLADFPRARVHLTDEARESVLAAQSEGDDAGRVRLRQWAHDVRWGSPPVPAEHWEGFAIWRLPDLPDRSDLSVRLVDLPGHSPGHAGVLVLGDRALLHAGDAYFSRTQVDGGEVTAGVTAFTEATDHDRGAREATQRRLADLVARGEVRVVSAHDASELPT